MAVQRSFPILLTRDLERLEAFYEAAFGASRTYVYRDDGREVYAALAVGDSQLAIGLEPDLEQPRAGAALWLYVDDVELAYRDALAAGATSVAEPAGMPWGERVAQVRDPDGLLVYLGAAATGVGEG